MTETEDDVVIFPADTDLVYATMLLRVGELVAFPTETVYGLGADAMNEEATARIFSVKGRPADHPLIVHVADAGEIDRWAREIPAEVTRLAAAFWPGALTMILKRHPKTPAAVSGGLDTIALRSPGHRVAQQLLQAFGGGVAAPSANRFGRISPTTAQHVREEFGKEIPFILDGGACTVGIESTIIDLSGERPTLLRPGMIGAEAIAEVLGEAPLIGGAGAARAPGGHDKHYAPTTPFQLLDADSINLVVQNAVSAGERIAVLAPFAAPVLNSQVSWLRAPEDPINFARLLYANLRRLDDLRYDRIVAVRPEGAAWAAIVDRLERAARGSGATLD